MAGNPWDFGDNMAQGVQTGLKIAEFKQNSDLKKAEALKARFEMMHSGATTALELAKETKDPQTKANLINDGVSPLLQLMGAHTATITPAMFDDPRTEDAYNTATKYAGKLLSGEMPIDEYNTRISMLMGATKDAGDRLKPLMENAVKRSPVYHSDVPGPGNTNTAGMVDPTAGTVTPLTNTLTGQPTMEGPKPKEVDPNVARVSLENGIRADEKTVQALINPPKGKAGIPDISGSLWTRIKNKGGPATWGDFNDKEQAQLALVQSTVQRLKSNLDSVNPLRVAQGLEPISIQPEVMALADKLTKIPGGPAAPAATTTGPKMIKVQLGSQVGQVPEDNVDQFLKDHKTARKL